MSASVRQKVLEKVDANRDKAIAFLQQMIAIPSVTGDEAPIQKFLADYMAKIGLDGRHVGDGLGGVEEASRLPARRARLRRTAKYRRDLKRDGRRALVAAQRAYRRHPGRRW